MTGCINHFFSAGTNSYNSTAVQGRISQRGRGRSLSSVLENERWKWDLSARKQMYYRKGANKWKPCNSDWGLAVSSRADINPLCAPSPFPNWRCHKQNAINLQLIIPCNDNTRCRGRNYLVLLCSLSMTSPGVPRRVWTQRMKWMSFWAGPSTPEASTACAPSTCANSS